MPSNTRAIPKKAELFVVEYYPGLQNTAIQASPGYVTPYTGVGFQLSKVLRIREKRPDLNPIQGASYITSYTGVGFQLSKVLRAREKRPD